MKLLVSVRSGAEAAAALEGGADVIDAKEPHAGALGAVSTAVFEDIGDAVARRAPVTAAIGDAMDEKAVERTARTFAAAGAWLVKIGFAGTTTLDRARSLIAAAAQGARAGNALAGVVAVAYADAAAIDCVGLDVVVEAAVLSGAAGVMVDTSRKEGPGLRQLMDGGDLARWARCGRDSGLLVAMAGRLAADDLGWVRDAGADIAGVRGAACPAGRNGSLSAPFVRELRERLHGQRVQGFS